jgi:hypothetical protein
VRTVSGTIGPILVAVGVAAGITAGVWMSQARPRAGALIDLVAIDGEWAIAVRQEQGGPRSFVELVSSSRGKQWGAYLPPYAGTASAPGVAISELAISVRVNRDGRAQAWMLSSASASKLGSVTLSGERPAVKSGYSLPGLTTLYRDGRSFEIIGELGEHPWAELIALDLNVGRILWRTPLPSSQLVGGQIHGDVVAIQLPDRSLTFDAATGRPATLPTGAADATDAADAGDTAGGDELCRSGADRVTFDETMGKVRSWNGAALRAEIDWPGQAPRRHHCADGTLWQWTGKGALALDATTLRARITPPN